MTNCDHFRAANHYVAKWTFAQASIGEESITDWLLFHLSANVNELKYLKFTKPQEARTTGADWEWWFVGNGQSLRLRIQAKRLRNGNDAYPSLAYANRYGLQIDKLLRDARSNNALPFYAMYVEPYAYRHMCRGAVRHQPLHQAIYISSADTIKRNFVSPPRQRVSVDNVIEFSNPIECLVCCPLATDPRISPVVALNQFINFYYPESRRDDESETPEESRGLSEDIPGYVSSLLSRSENDRFEWFEEEFSSSLPAVDGIVALDLREMG